MSAIWGIINLEDKGIHEKQIEIIKHAFDKCVMDRREEYKESNVYMGCGIQYITDEAKYEEGPICDDEKEFFFDADVILDNRDELLKDLRVESGNTSIPDGTLLYKMIAKYGKECLNTLLGAYAFVYYDKKKKEVNIVLDAVGNRCVYYRVIDNCVYYSSLIEPLITVGKDNELNGRWITDFIAMDHLFMINEAEETPVKDIYRVAPAQIVTIRENCISKNIYWNPFESVKELKYKKDEPYKTAFRSIFTEAVKCTLRTKNNISIFLSGGLDSTAVASVAAGILRESNRDLYTYTSVPEKGYIPCYTKDRMDDEQEMVLKTQKFLGNLKCNFIELKGKNAWDERKHQLNMLEMPYKSVQNLIWIEEGMKRAYENNSRIMLNGSFGNSTISFSDFECYISSLYASHRYIKVLKELNQFQSLYGYSRKYAIKRVFGSKHMKRDSGKKTSRAYVKKSVFEKYKVEQRLDKMNQEYLKCSDDFMNYKKLLYSSRPLRQIGEINTKQSLMTGVVVRDPSKDKRLIEFCISLPINQFIKDGEERRLVNVYLSDIMPKHVLNKRRKGRQSADLKYKIQKQWDMIRKEWYKEYQRYKDNEYVDCEKALQDLNKQTDIESLTEFDLVRHIYTITTLEYMEEFQLDCSQ